MIDEWKPFGARGLVMPPDTQKSLTEKLRHLVLEEMAVKGYRLHGEIKFSDPSVMFWGGKQCSSCGHASKLRSEYAINAHAWGVRISETMTTPIEVSPGVE